MKGLNQLKEKLPNYQGKKILALPLLAIGGILSGLTFQLVITHLAIIMPTLFVITIIEPILYPMGTILIFFIAFPLISGIWRNKQQFMQENPKTAYQRGILPGFFGISLIFSIIIRNMFSSFLVEPKNSITDLFANSWFTLLINNSRSMKMIKLFQIIIFSLMLLYGVLTLKKILNSLWENLKDFKFTVGKLET